MEVYPITIDGEDAGTLRVEQQGARTVFTADCGMSTELLRISVYGGGREGYLGLLVPEEGRLRLRRALSRDAMRDFPEEIEQVERAGMMPEPLPRPQVWQEAPEPLPEAPPEEAPMPPPEADPPAEDGSLSWYASPDGALVCFDGTGTLIALPPDDGRVPPEIPGERRSIEGKEYLVYRTRNGKIITGV
ncbi:MAG: hypothetical protein IJ617_05850 [Oscillospiraceae bacterium]|nr:hypothetical protein [Oscillospiraceae bacterium]